MAYWVKTQADYDRYTYRYDGEKIDYRLKTYEGPFKSLSEVEDYLQDGLYDWAEVLYMESV